METNKYDQIFNDTNISTDEIKILLALREFTNLKKEIIKNIKLLIVLNDLYKSLKPSTPYELRQEVCKMLSIEENKYPVLLNDLNEIEHSITELQFCESLLEDVRFLKSKISNV